MRPDKTKLPAPRLKSVATLAPRVIACALMAIVCAGCATRVPAPVVERTPLAPLPPPVVATPAPAPEPVVPTYVVKRGDTLRVIAQDKGVDFHDLAAWNNLDNPNRLSVGQVLRLAAPGSTSEALPVPGPTDVTGPGVVTAPLREPPPIVAGGAPPAGPAAEPRNADNYKSSPKAIKLPYGPDARREFDRLAAGAQAAPPPAATDATPPAASPAVVARAEPSPAARPPSPALGSGDDQLEWMWPAKGKVVGAFSETSNLKGIDIAGADGTPVVASAAGKVVYAGSGLRGYGKLVIIKHNDTYLSAYAHNRAIVVKEGDAVARGQKIAEMGASDADQVKLHFEIRRLGKPMDPAKYLPPA